MSRGRHSQAGRPAVALRSPFAVGRTHRRRRDTVPRHREGWGSRRSDRRSAPRVSRSDVPPSPSPSPRRCSETWRASSPESCSCRSGIRHRTPRHRGRCRCGAGSPASPPRGSSGRVLASIRSGLPEREEPMGESGAASHDADFVSVVGGVLEEFGVTDAPTLAEAVGCTGIICGGLYGCLRPAAGGPPCGLLARCPAVSRPQPPALRRQPGRSAPVPARTVRTRQAQECLRAMLDGLPMCWQG